MAKKPWHHATESNTARGYGSQWRKLRAVVLKVDKMGRPRELCRPCLAGGRVIAASQCDHIVPKAKGGTDDLSNLQPICIPCHDAKTQRESAEAQGRRVKVQIGIDGWPVE